MDEVENPELLDKMLQARVEWASKNGIKEFLLDCTKRIIAASRKEGVPPRIIARRIRCAENWICQMIEMRQEDYERLVGKVEEMVEALYEEARKGEQNDK